MPDAARHLANIFEEEVTEADVLRLIHIQPITLIELLQDDSQTPSETVMIGIRQGTRHP